MVCAGVVGCSDPVVLKGEAPLRASLELQASDASLFTPNTQSFLRGHHWLDQVHTVQVSADSHDMGQVDMAEDDAEHSFRIVNVPMQQLVPRLHYRAAAVPDAFDSFNLMMAEYSRNGVSFAVGVPGDDHAHFETSLPQRAPWTLAGDYEFVPDPHFRPVRVSLVNNCLASGLWEFSGVDRAGEVHHSWFDFPADYYAELTARTNGVPVDFVTEALTWKTEAVLVDLDRLRQPGATLEPVTATLDTGATGYSSQGSRRKLSKGFVQVRDETGTVRMPNTRQELTTHPVLLTAFVPPGRYDPDERKEFDLRFLAQPGPVAIQRVTPLTHYNAPTASVEWEGDYLEMSIPLGEHTLILGNLPVERLVPQEELALHGFGVGILPASDFAERRAMLVDRGPAPSFAYLTIDGPDGRQAVNSHDRGIEQVFIRALPDQERPQFVITITSFERIVDLARLRVDIPPSLVPELRAQAQRYISPVYLTYRDDNLR
jgi:hypothetical protein